MDKIDVCWQKEEYDNLDYNTIFAYGTKPFALYTQDIFKQIICVDAYHLPKPMPGFVDKVIKQLDHKVTAPAINRMLPGCVLPPHRDEYKKFVESYNVKNTDDITRYLVFLEDSLPGQMIQIESHTYTHWRRGDCVSWTGSTQHGALNMSYQDRYILQLTCFDKT